MSKHRGFWLSVDDEPVHVTGDPNMSKESADALAELVRVVRQHVAEMTPEEWDAFKRTSVQRSPPGTRVVACDA